jgi:hypothetical protein
MTVLLNTRLAPILPPGRDLSGWYEAVTEEIAQHLTAAHASLLARPEASPSGTAWIVPDADWRRQADLPVADRGALLRALGAIRSDIRRLAESGVAPAVAAAWPVLWTVPDLSYVFAVAGRPVLAGWSLPNEYAGTVLDRYDDGVGWVAPSRTPWRIYCLTLGTLAVLALAAGLLLPLMRLDLARPPTMCKAVPGQLALMREQAAAAVNGDQLRTTLAALTGELGRRQLTCPLRQAPRAPLPASVPTPLPRADLPQEQWQRHDLSMLEGCWNLTSRLFLGSQGQHTEPVSVWRMCFGRSGQGSQTEGTQLDGNCHGPVAAQFDGDKLQITEPQNCFGPNLRLNRMELLCARVGDSRADCQGRNLPSGEGFTAEFQR